MPKKQTIASKKYQEKVGMISKSYKLRIDTVERFAEACEKHGVSQAAKITEMMNEFIKLTEELKDDTK